jgi:hypothetical protein
MLELISLQLIEQHKERIREAERELRIKEALGNGPKQSKIYDRAVERLGNRLVTWGQQLQAVSRRRRSNYI